MTNEYIRKQDASDAVIKHLQLDYECAWGAREAINALPSADVVPVVRCKDCKFYTSMRQDIKTGICDLNVHHMGDDGFCSYGERREE